MRGSPQNTRIICLLGIDGSGKTTHAYKIFSDLKKSGKKCKYVWSGMPYFFSYPFMVLCRVLNLTKIHDLPNKSTFSEHKYYMNKPIALIWPWIQFLDLVIFIFLRIYIPLWNNFIVVCDRFIYDILVDLMIDVGDDKLHEKFIGGLILKLKPKMIVEFLLDVDETIAFQRKLDIPDINYLVRRRRYYILIANCLQIPIINAESPFLIVHKEMNKKLMLKSLF